MALDVFADHDLLDDAGLLGDHGLVGHLDHLDRIVGERLLVATDGPVDRTPLDVHVCLSQVHLLGDRPLHDPRADPDATPFDGTPPHPDLFADDGDRPLLLAIVELEVTVRLPDARAPDAGARAGAHAGSPAGLDTCSSASAAPDTTSRCAPDSASVSASGATSSFSGAGLAVRRRITASTRSESLSSTVSDSSVSPCRTPLT